LPSDIKVPTDVPEEFAKQPVNQQGEASAATDSLADRSKWVRSLETRRAEADVLVGYSGGSGLADGDVKGGVHVDAVEEGILVSALEALHLRSASHAVSQARRAHQLKPCRATQGINAAWQVCVAHRIRCDEGNIHSFLRLVNIFTTS